MSYRRTRGAEGGGAPLAVLIVEPRDDLRERLARLLAGVDLLRLREADSAPGALDVLGHERIDAVVLDVDAEPGSGLDAIRRFRARAPRAVIIALGADDEPEMAERCCLLGADFYLVISREFVRLRDMLATLARAP
jgi:CheY-like chemotaxis protein